CEKLACTFGTTSSPESAGSRFSWTIRQAIRWSCFSRSCPKPGWISASDKGCHRVLGSAISDPGPGRGSKEIVCFGRGTHACEAVVAVHGRRRGGHCLGIRYRAIVDGHLPSRAQLGEAAAGDVLRIEESAGPVPEHEPRRGRPEERDQGHWPAARD